VSKGDHIWVRRFGYTHHGLDVGDDMVVHFTGTPGSKRNAAIQKDSLEAFAQGGEVSTRDYGRRFDADEAAQRAESRVGQSGYDLYRNNCEHFARWCVTGDHKSKQVETANAAGGVGVSTATAAAGVGVVSAVGASAGLSGAGIMSGLATVGTGVGAGAVGGLVVLGAAPGVMSAAVINLALRDDEALPEQERSARGVGRKASVGGVLAGSASGVVAVSTAGSVAGLSAAGITSGLAAIGSVVGGGMAAGTAVVIAGPAVGAAAIGYGAYRLTKRTLESPDGKMSRAKGLASDLRRRAEGGLAHSAQEVSARLKRVRGFDAVVEATADLGPEDEAT
jgi:hypothetical protein